MSPGRHDVRCYDPPLMKTELRLRVEPAVGEPFARPLDQESLVIGRSRDADLQVDDRFMSRRHTRVYSAAGELLVEDLGSRNGTLVNDRRIEVPTPVGPGDVIKISQRFRPAPGPPAYVGLADAAAQGSFDLPAPRSRPGRGCGRRRSAALRRPAQADERGPRGSFRVALARTAPGADPRSRLRAPAPGAGGDPAARRRGGILAGGEPQARRGHWKPNTAHRSS